MGNNAAYAAFESTVIACYNNGDLTKKLLSDLMEPYRDSDIDSGGEQGLMSKPVVGPDGIKRRLDVVDIVIQTWTGKPPADKPKGPRDYNRMTPDQKNAFDDWIESKQKSFRKITNHFGWC